MVEYMSDVDSYPWSMGWSKVNFFKLMTVFSGVFAVGKWFTDICMWKNPITTVLVHVFFLMLVCFPELILPQISQVELVHPDELDEEFDTFPTSRNS
ncbi:hypothetical protein ACFX2I_014583 [Malus domestica]